MNNTLEQTLLELYKLSSENCPIEFRKQINAYYSKCFQLKINYAAWLHCRIEYCKLLEEVEQDIQKLKKDIRFFK